MSAFRLKYYLSLVSSQNRQMITYLGLFFQESYCQILKNVDVNRFAKLKMENDSYVLHFISNQINLTIRHNGQIFHCPIKTNQNKEGQIDKYFMSEADKFDNIQDLITFYQTKRFYSSKSLKILKT